MAETKAQREAREAQEAADTAAGSTAAQTPPGDDAQTPPGDDGTPNVTAPDLRAGDAGQATPTTDPATTDTAATLATADPEKIAPKQYSGPKVGDTAERTLYGTIDSTGAITPTGNGGADEPGEGERGAVIVAQGDTVTRSIVTTLAQG